MTTYRYDMTNGRYAIIEVDDGGTAHFRGEFHGDGSKSHTLPGGLWWPSLDGAKRWWRGYGYAHRGGRWVRQ